ncbi:unnamed protein product [Eruca vesicaria subsp. sativa]|uniref:RRM domain-containing protein n=1 Tax=Eruca vesicaria subsp. sativa TaxID=29727 RepID=A0ABC8K1W6_ERUVS|nr:unnamed protein product [Eruca vesicaria subsp. sativa]
MENLASELDLLNLSTMDGYGSRRLIWNDPHILSVKSKIRNVGRVFVTGYDINLPHDDVDGALRKLFSPCGLITDICIRYRDNRLERRAVVYIVGESTVEKALQLSGSDVGGWKAIVTPYPFPKDAGRSITIWVSGYDTSLSEIDIESAIRQHFSSCGEITDVEISKSSSAEVDIDGEDAQDKVMELDGSHMGGRELLVDVVSGGVNTFHRKRHCYIHSRDR